MKKLKLSKVTGIGLTICYVVCCAWIGIGSSMFLSTCQPSGTTSATYTAAHDPVVVDSEKSLRISKDTFDIFLRLEHENQADVAKLSPKIHDFAEYLRREAPNWLLSANNLKNAYKHNRTSENKANLETALATLAQATKEAQNYINEIQDTHNTL